MLASSSLSAIMSSSAGASPRRPGRQRRLVVARRPRRRDTVLAPIAARKVQIEHRVVGVAVLRSAHHGARERPRAVPRGHRVRAHASPGRHRPSRTGPPNALPAQRFDELDQVAGNTVRRQRLRRAGASDGHQLSLSSPTALVWSDGCLSTTPRVAAISSSSRCPIPARRGCAPSRSSRRSTAPS